MQESNERLMSLKEVAKKMGVTKAAVRVAVNKGRLKAHKIRVNNHEEWAVTPSGLKDYINSKYDQSKRMVDGKRIFDPENGTFSVSQAAERMEQLLGYEFSIHRMYYMIRAGYLRIYRRSYTVVIKEEDLIELYEREKGMSSIYFPKESKSV